MLNDHALVAGVEASRLAAAFYKKGNYYGAGNRGGTGARYGNTNSAGAIQLMELALDKETPMLEYCLLTPC